MLSQDLVSVGLVGDNDDLLRRNQRPEEVFAAELARCPGLKQRLTQAELTDGFYVAKEFSYTTRQSAGDERDRIVWTGPKGPGRQTLVLRASYDEGKTFVNERVISSDKAAYSDLTVLDDKSVGVIWERAGYAYITYSRFTLDFLEP